MKLRIPFISTVLVCSLLIMGGSYCLPIQADEPPSMNVTQYKTENLANLTQYYGEDSLLIDNPTSGN